MYGTKCPASSRAIFASLLLTLLWPSASSGGTSPRQMSFVNECGETVWLGGVTNSLSGGWVLPARTPCISSDDCAEGLSCDTSLGLCKLVLVLPTESSIGGLEKVSGRFWPRTGCNFEADGSCPGGHNCCATGGCTVDGPFGLQCAQSGVAPVTVAEFTLQSGNGKNDFYDVSVIDGFNVPVEMAPDSSPPCEAGFADCDYWCGNPGSRYPSTTGLADFPCDWQLGEDCGSKPELRVVAPTIVESAMDCGDPTQFRDTSIGGVCTCGLDADGGRLESDCAGGELCGFGNNEIIGTRVCGEAAGCTTGKVLCAPPYFLGSGGDPCSNNSNCASGMCDAGRCTASPVDFLACSEPLKVARSCTGPEECPALIGFSCAGDQDCPASTECVPLGGSPGGGKVCRQRCQGGKCTAAACSSDADCLTQNGHPNGTFSRCDTSTHQCVGTVASLFQASGLNGQSCYISYYETQTAPSASCGGCPTDCEDPPCLPWPEPPPTHTCLNSNPDWKAIAEPYAALYKDVCPTAYTFPFDDPTSTFQCSGGTPNTVSYTVTFCPSGSALFSDGFEAGNTEAWSASTP